MAVHNPANDKYISDVDQDSNLTGDERLLTTAGESISVSEFVSSGDVRINSLPVDTASELSSKADQSDLDGLEVATASALSTKLEAIVAGDNIDIDYTGDPLKPTINVIGLADQVVYGGGAGNAGYGVAAPLIPAGFEPVRSSGYRDKESEYFGNLRHINSGSIGVVKPAMLFKAGTGVNEWESAYLADFSDLATAEAAGWWLHEAFYAGGTESAPDVVQFLFVDKYLASAVSVGTGVVAASVKDGNPLSPNSNHNPIGDITACSGVNKLYAAVRAPHGRDSANGEYDATSKFYCATRQIQGLMMLLSQCHGQAATSTTHCAWYDPAGITNFPKGCDNNSLGSVDDGSLSWTSDGYSNAAKTGSCNDPAKTAVNGQLCDVMEMGGNMYQIGLGITRGSDQVDGDTNFMVLKKHVDPADLYWGSGGAKDAWGTVSDLSDRYDLHNFPVIDDSSSSVRMGNGANQVLDKTDVTATSLGLPVSATAVSTDGTTEYGNDALYLSHVAQVCLISGGAWNAGSGGGVFASYLSLFRLNAPHHVGFRAACALEV